MKKRLLSLLLAFVTLAAALPVFTLVIAGDVDLPATPYTTAFVAGDAETRQNFPYYDGEKLVIPDGPWSVGYKAGAAEFEPYTQYTSQGEGILVHGTDDQWTNGGMYLTNGGAYGYGNVLALAGHDIAIRYTAEYTGTATLDVRKVFFPVADNAVFAVFRNGVMIWPNTETGRNHFTDSTKWFAGEKANFNYGTANTASAAGLLLEGVTLVKGDTIDFVSRTTGGIDYRSVYGFDIAVTYTAFPEVPQWLVTYTDANGIPVTRILVDDGALLPENPNTLLTKGYDVNGDGEVDDLPATVTADITLVPVGDYSSLDQFKAPLIDGLISTGRNGNWAAAHGYFDADVSEAKTAHWSYSPDTDLLTVAASSSILQSAGAELWDLGGGGLYVDSHRFALRRASTTVALGAVYTAPATGMLALDMTALKASRNPNPGMAAGFIETYIAIVKNGTIVWPSDGKPYCYKAENVEGREDDILALAKAYEAFPTIPVAEGDEIAFVGCTGADEAAWGLVMTPMVHYTALTAPTRITAIGATAGDGFSLRYTVTGDALATAGGILYNGQKIAGVRQADGTYIATLPGIAARQMTDAYAVTPYATIGTSDMLGDECETTYAAVLNATLNAAGTTEKDKNVIRATLHYGAAAQTYFNYHAATPADEGLPAADAPRGTFENVYALSSDLGDEAEAVFESVSLILGDNVGIKLVIRGAGEYKIQMADNADFTGATESGLTHCRIGSAITEYKAIFSGIAVEDWDTTYYFRVVDGDGVAVSETLTYSVLTYTQRITSDAIRNALLTLYLAQTA